MSICFALNHGTVTALTAMASSQLGILLGNVSSGLLYGTYTLVAAFFACWTTTNLGAKRTLVLGLGIYCAYIASYLLAYLVPSIKWYAILLGSFLGGIGGGLVWPAQGVYYSQSAALLANEKQSREECNSLLSGVFAATFLCGEFMMKLLSSVIPSCAGKAGIRVLYIFFTLVATLSVALISLIETLDDKTEHGNQAPNDKILGATFLSALQLLIHDPRCALMIPFSFSFGLGVAYMNGYFFVSVVSDQISTYAVGYVAAIVVFSAALIALPNSRLGAFLGTQAPIVALGALCTLIFALVNLIFTPSQLGTWPFVVLLAFSFGAGRSTWEGSLKATFADYFPNNTKAAFANVQLQSGLATALGFVLDITTSPTTVGICVVLSSFMALFATLLAHHLHSSEQSPHFEQEAQEQYNQHELRRHSSSVLEHLPDSDKKASSNALV